MVWVMSEFPTPGSNEGDSADFHTGTYTPTALEVEAAREDFARDLGRRYEFSGYLGRGAFATVWKALDRVTQEFVAVKRLVPVIMPEKRGEDALYSELRALFALDDSRIVRLINLREVRNGARYLIFEHCAGGSLRQWMQRAARGGKRFTVEQTVELVRQVAEGLAYAHRHGLIHRDLKPENILFDQVESDRYEGRVTIKLADFGLAKAYRRLQFQSAEAQAIAVLPGHPAYMAPEQFASTFLPASDLYALGVIWYELLHQRLPFEGSVEELSRQHLHSAPIISGELPRPVIDLLSSLLEKYPQERLSDANVLAQRLSKWFSDRPRPAVRRKTSFARCMSAACADAALRNSPAPELMVATNAGLYRFSAESGQPVGVEPLVSIRRLTPDGRGGVWMLQRSALHHWAASAPSPTLIVHSESPLDAFAASVPAPLAEQHPRLPHGSERLLLCYRDRLCEYILPDLQLVWTAELPVMARLCRRAIYLPDGRIVFTTDGDNCKLWVLSPDRKQCTDFDLPETCEQLLVMGGGNRVYLRLGMRGDQRIWRLDPGSLRLVTVALPETIAYFAPTPDGEGVYGLTSDGRVLAWSPKKSWHTLFAFDDPSERYRAFATDGAHFAALGRREQEDWILGLTLDTSVVERDVE